MFKLPKVLSHGLLVLAGLLTGLPFLHGGCATDATKTDEFLRAKALIAEVEAGAADGLDGIEIQKRDDAIVLLHALYAKLEAEKKAVEGVAGAAGGAGDFLPPPFGALTGPAAFALAALWLRRQGRAEVEKLIAQAIGLGGSPEPPKKE